MKPISTLFSPLVHLFYPHNCEGCGNDILPGDNLLCLSCINELPHTFFASHPDNPVEKIFWGRLPVVAAMSEFYFRKGTLIQNLIHAFKYKGNKDMGKYLGRMMGESLLHCGRFQNIDLIIPLPLFAAKEHKRGFNQAAILCAGLSAKLKSNFANDCVIRKQFTETQTKKHRTERWQNVSGSFETINDQNLEGKHILLVDDVITTGATLEACGNEILKVEGTKISVATLAFASK